MKICRLLLTTFIVSVLLVSNSFAQKNWALDADNAFQYKQYYEAIGLYKKAYTKIKKNKAERARVIFQTAECYRLTNDTKQAEVWYKKAIGVKYPDVLTTLYYADMMKANEKYEDAIVQYNAYKELAPDDTRGTKGAESCALAQQWKDNPTRYEVENVKQFNSKDMDFATTYYDKKYKSLIFTSTREGSTGAELDFWTGQNFSDLYLTAQDKKGTWSTPSTVGENINTKFNEGAACLNDKCNEMYFTRCGVEKKKELSCQIYMAKKKGTAWDIPDVVPLGADSFTYGHPALSSDELTLYFASDMDGGYGGKDIWMVKRTKKTKAWDAAVNLGKKINTDGDEMYPFIRDDGMLFFASSGLLGMGGLDIFKVEKVGDNFGNPTNLKYPINSAGDDFAIIFEGKLEKGYLSSNRKGGKGSDDIYSFYQPPLLFTLQGTICNDSSKTTPKEMIKGAIITLSGSDGTIISDTTDALGAYKFDNKQFLGNTSYVIEVTSKGYFGAKGKETTLTLERSKDFVHDFCLIPIPKTAIVLPEIRYGLAEWDLKPQYQDSLNGLIKTLEDNPQLVIELGSHTDNRGSLEYNDSLSFKRAKSVVDYLISKGIAGDRMVPTGYGERVPRTLSKDITVKEYVKGGLLVTMKTPVKFTKGTYLTEEYINKFTGDENKFEAAHQLNRRTEFKVLRDDYVPTNSSGNTPNIDIKIDTNAVQDTTKEQNYYLDPENQLDGLYDNGAVGYFEQGAPAIIEQNNFAVLSENKYR
ncbi:MAG: OmpA family protein [Bacteroidota bacterium]